MAVRPISLRWLVPAISAVILATAVTVFGTIAYRSVRASALEAAAEHLTTVVQVFAQPPQQPPAWIRASQTVARSPDILEIVQSGGQRVSDSARALVARLTPDTGQTLATDVRSANGTVLFSITSAVAESLATVAGKRRPVTTQAGDSLDRDLRQFATPARLPRAYPDSAATSELFRDGSQVLFERAVPIRDRGRTVGHVVEVRKVAASPNAISRLNSLIGQEAALVVGNRDGSLWSDLQKPVAHPPPATAPQHYVRDGRRWISATTPSSTVPWVIGVDLPEDIVLKPVHALRWRLVLIGTSIVLLAVLITERLSRRLTVPLRSLTTAAEDIAAGHRTTPGVSLQRPDEIGRLSRAFSAMADSIRTSHDTLEHQIDERTQELRTTLARLHMTQDELVRQERLAMLGHLSGSIAHELRNPLGVMTNSLYYLETVLGDAPPKVRQHMLKLRAQVRLSDSIITGLLNVTRTRPPQVEMVSVEQLADEQLERASIPASITIERDIAPNMPPLRVDPVQVGQILLNLFTNAVQAMEGTSGVLTVRARVTGDRVRIEVRDTGPGIRPEDRERIFEPLFTTKTRGIGLGLSVSRTLARVNEGELNLSAESGTGAVLILDLPAASQTPMHLELPALESPARAGI